MMKKMLLTLTAAGMLAVPAGVALAQDDGAEPNEPVATCEEQVRRQDRNRVNEGDSMADHGQDRARNQVRIQDGDGDCDGTGSQGPANSQNRVADGSGDQAQYRRGEMGNAGQPRRRQLTQAEGHHRHEPSFPAVVSSPRPRTEHHHELDLTRQNSTEPTEPDCESLPDSHARHRHRR